MSDAPAVAEPGGLAGHPDGAVRAAGIPVGISQAVDAAEILTVVDLLDREQLRHGLAAVLLQRAAQRPAYDVLFDLWWPLSERPAVPAAEDGSDGEGGEPGESTLDLPDGTDLAQLMREELSRLLLDGDEEALRRFAREAVDQLGRTAPSPSGQSFFSYRVMRALSPDTLVAQLLAGLLGDAQRGGLAEQVARQTAKERITAFRTAVEAEVRRRTAAERGRDKVAKNAVRPLADQVDFLRAQAADLAPPGPAGGGPPGGGGAGGAARGARGGGGGGRAGLPKARRGVAGPGGGP